MTRERLQCAGACQHSNGVCDSGSVGCGAFFGGGNEIPEASVSDGQLAIVAVRPRPILQLLFTFLMVRLNRQTPRRTSTLVHIRSQRCLVHTGKPKTVTADGDVVSRTPLNVVCKSGCLRVIGDRIVSTADGDAGDVISGGT